ncbi:hypothetical protein ES705_39323 [subsurface metagenome]
MSFANDLTAFDENLFTTALDDISAAGGNCIRWWLHTDGTSSPYFTNDSVSRITDNETLALYKGLDLAYDRGMGIIMCLWSFDMLRSSNSDEIKNRNRLMLTDSVYMQAYINNALIPMLETVGDHPAVICWEIFNEPEGMTPVGGWGHVDDVPITAVQTFINRTAGAIHRNTDSAKVSNGCWSFIAGTDVDGNYNYYTDERLVAQGSDPDGYLDFYMVHYYDWAGTSLSPFHHPASYWELDKPLVIGEFAANGPYAGINARAAYDSLYQNGYAGALSWQWAGNEFGGLPSAEPGINYITTNYPDDVNIDYPVIEFNHYPEVIHSIQDTVMEMGLSSPGPFVNLKNVFKDKEDSVFLTFSISFNTNPDLVLASIDVDSNLVLELIPEVSGVSEIHVKATDSGKKFALEKFSVYVYDPSEPNKALLRKAWASSTESSLLLPGNAIDGSLTTRWSSLYADNEWIAVDLGKEYTIECVDLNWETAYGSEYEIQVTSDTISWQTVYHQTDGDGGKDIVLFTPVSCQYVRMYGIYRATQWGFSLWELGVYEDSLTTDVYTPVTNLDDIKIYPIPFDNWFTVQSTESNPIRRVEVYNLNSALIESFDYNNGVTEINISLPGIQPGLYYVVIYSNSSVAVKKVLKF